MALPTHANTAYSGFTPPTPSWNNTTSNAAIDNRVGGTGYTITDQHFEGIIGRAIQLENWTNVTIKRCTFADVGEAIYLAACTNITIVDCAFYNVMGTRGSFTELGHAILLNGCDTFTITDCWVLQDDPTSNVEDIFNIYNTDNGTISGCRIWAGEISTTGTGILLGDGNVNPASGGNNLTASNNVVIDAQISAIGTNCTVTGNAVLGRGLYPARDVATFGIGSDHYYVGNTIGPLVISNNEVCWFLSTTAPGGVHVASDITCTGLTTNTVGAPIDERTRWTPTGYYGWI